MKPIDYKEFWKHPVGKTFIPEFYVGLQGVTSMVTTTLLKYLPLDASIIELGCGTGRNLAGLKAVGFTNLFGVDISASTIALGRKSFPLLDGIDIKCASIEDAIGYLPEADCYFTQGVLMHLPPTSEWVFEVMSRKAKKLIMTSENEDHGGNISWPRNYGKIFEAFGWTELESEKCGKYGDLPDTTIKHVLKKEQVIDESPSPQLPGKSEAVDKGTPGKWSGNRKRSRKQTAN